MVGAKRALKPQQVWAIRFWLDRERRLRDRAMFDLAIDSKLRGCDVVKVKIGDLVSGDQIRSRAIVIQQKTGRPVHCAKNVFSEHGAVPEMKEGPSEPVCRSWLQTAVSCFSPKGCGGERYGQKA
jgi:hypothetical protein